MRELLERLSRVMPEGWSLESVGETWHEVDQGEPMRDLLEQYQESKSDHLAHQIAQRMLDVSSGSSERLRRMNRNPVWSRDDWAFLLEVADALDLAEAERAESNKAWEELAERCKKTGLSGDNYVVVPVLDVTYSHTTKRLHAQIAKAKDRIAKRGGA